MAGRDRRRCPLPTPLRYVRDGLSSAQAGNTRLAVGSDDTLRLVTTPSASYKPDSQERGCVDQATSACLPLPACRTAASRCPAGGSRSTNAGIARGGTGIAGLRAGRVAPLLLSDAQVVLHVVHA